MTMLDKSGTATSRLVASGRALVRYDARLLESARAYIAAGAPTDLQFTVVLAAMAVEVTLDQALGELRQQIEPPAAREWVAAQLKPRSPRHEALLELYRALSGHRLNHDPEGEPRVWARYVADVVELRHEVVHKAQAVDKSQAEASVEAARGLIARIDEQVFGISSA
jgi:hypothetical protein